MHICNEEKWLCCQSTREGKDATPLDWLVWLANNTCTNGPGAYARVVLLKSRGKCRPIANNEVNSAEVLAHRIVESSWVKLDFCYVPRVLRCSMLIGRQEPIHLIYSTNKSFSCLGKQQKMLFKMNLGIRRNTRLKKQIVR